MLGSWCAEYTKLCSHSHSSDCKSGHAFQHTHRRLPNLTYSVSTLAALGLDIYVRRKQTSRGIYRLHDMDGKRASQLGGEPFFDGRGYAAGGLAAPRESGIWEESRRSTGPYNEQSEKLVQEEDYAHPQVGKYDTGYHGARPSMG